jgi:hypothetical protein
MRRILNALYELFNEGLQTPIIPPLAVVGKKGAA